MPIQFGKYKGKTIQEIFLNDPAYIEWCILKIPEFFIPSREFNRLKELKPEYVVNVKVEYKISQKEEIIAEEQESSKWDNIHKEINRDFYDEMRNQGWEPEDW